MPVSRIKLVFFWLVTFGILLGLWFLYTDTLKVSELLVGAGAAALGATGMAVVEGQRFAAFSPDPRWLTLLLIEPWYVLVDTATVWWEGLKALCGHLPRPEMRAIPFDAGGDDERSAARRTVAITLPTIPPNSIVVEIERDRQLALVHFLIPTSTPPLLKKLGARA